MLINVKGIMSFEISASDMETAIDLANDKEFTKSLIAIDGFEVKEVSCGGVTKVGPEDFEIELNYTGKATSGAYKLLTVLSSTIESWI